MWVCLRLCVCVCVCVCGWVGVCVFALVLYDDCLFRFKICINKNNNNKIAILTDVMLCVRACNCV